MGCLFELFFEIFVEGIIELLGYCFMKLMLLIVPEKALTEKAKTNIVRIATAVSVVLCVVLIVGVIISFADEPGIATVGKYMTFIPLGIISVQILFGIAAKIIAYHKKRRNIR